MWLTRSIGVLLHPTSLPGGRLGAEAYAFVDWLAAAGSRWWQVLPLGPPDRYGSPYASASAFACWPGLLADPERAGGAVRGPAFAQRHAYWIGTGPRSRAATRSPTRCASSASGRRCARTRPSAACGSSATSRSTSPRRAATTARTRSSSCPRASSPARRRTRSNELGQHWGNPLYDWDGAGAERLPLVDRAHPPRARARRPLPDRPLPRLRRLLGGARRSGDGAETATGSRGRGQPSSVPSSRSSGPLPVIAEDLGVITPDVVELRDELGFPGMVVLLWAFDGPSDNPHRLENHRENQVVYTSTHDTDTLARRSSRDAGTMAADRAGALVARSARDRARAGRARPRQRGPDEPPGRDRRQLDVAARARPAGPARRPSPARRRGGSRPCVTTCGGSPTPA